MSKHSEDANSEVVVIMDSSLEGEPSQKRLLSRGAQALTEAELVSVVATGDPRNPLDGQDILDHHPSVIGLLAAEAETLRFLPPPAAARVLAAVELARRLNRKTLPFHVMDHPRKVARYIWSRYALMDQVVLGALFLDSSSRPIHDRELARGCLKRAAVEPRSILRAALNVGADGVVLFHTHPSADAKPSYPELGFTDRMDSACKVMGIRLVDHIIVAADGTWVSMAEQGFPQIW